jgi:hypothetical protein
MIIRRIIVPLALCIANSLYSQNPEPDQFIRDSLEIAKVKLVRPQFRFDNRQTFVSKQALGITGFDAGVLLSDKLRVTLGYYSMKDRLAEFDEVIEGEEFGRLIELRYGSFNTELIYRDTRFLSFGMPLEVGVGVNKFQNKNITTGQVLSTQKGVVAFVNFGMSATFKPMRFLGLKGMIGYRKVAYNQVKDYNFDGFFTSIGLNIDVHAIVTDVRMYRLKKKYNRGNNIQNAVEIITD